MRRLIVCVALLAVGCGADSPAMAPTPIPPVPICQSQNTGTVFFENRSTGNFTYDVLWDGSILTTIPPGKDSQVYTFAANIQHTLVFRFTNSTILACNASTPVLTVCGATFYGCSG